MGEQPIAAARVTLSQVLDAPQTSWLREQAALPVAIGIDAAGEPVGTDLADYTALLVIGPDGSGKSVSVNTLICSLLMTRSPAAMRLLLFDPTGVELTQYRGIPHLATDVIVDPAAARNALRWLAETARGRLAEFRLHRVANLKAYNDGLQSYNTAMGSGTEPLPYLVCVLDEAEVLLQGDEESAELIARIAQDAHAAGICLVLATGGVVVGALLDLLAHQWVSVVAFGRIPDARLEAPRDPNDRPRGPGSLLYYPAVSQRPNRVRGVQVPDTDIAAIVRHWRSEGGPQFLPGVGTGTVPEPVWDEPPDALLGEAIGVVRSADKASASLLQRRFRIGYERAAHLLDQLEDHGVVGPPDGTRFREVLHGALASPWSDASDHEDAIGLRVLAENPVVDPRVANLHPEIHFTGSQATPKGATLECLVRNGEAQSWSGFEVIAVVYGLQDGSTLATFRNRFDRRLEPGDEVTVRFDADVAAGRSLIRVWLRRRSRRNPTCEDQRLGRASRSRRDDRE